MRLPASASMRPLYWESNWRQRTSRAPLGVRTSLNPVPKHSRLRIRGSTTALSPQVAIGRAAEAVIQQALLVARDLTGPDVSDHPRVGVSAVVVGVQRLG